MRLYIVRHADPDYPGNTITAHGHAESEALARRFAREGLTDLYSSPVNRALHTAEHTELELGLPVTVLSWTEEFHSLWVPDDVRGTLPAWDVPGEKLLDPARAEVHPEYDGVPLEETLTRVRKHSDRFLADLGYAREGHRYQVERENSRRLALFCHGGFGLTWIAMLLQIPVPLAWAGFWLAPSSVTTILFDRRSASHAVPRCLGLGDIGHLSEAGLAPRPRGIVANFD